MRVCVYLVYQWSLLPSLSLKKKSTQTKKPPASAGLTLLLLFGGLLYFVLVRHARTTSEQRDAPGGQGTSPFPAQRAFGRAVHRKRHRRRSEWPPPASAVSSRQNGAGVDR